jgi:hypothetical protein
MKTNNPSATSETEKSGVLNRFINKPAVTTYKAARIVKVVTSVINAYSQRYDFPRRRYPSIRDRLVTFV